MPPARRNKRRTMSIISDLVEQIAHEQVLPAQSAQPSPICWRHHVWPPLESCADCAAEIQQGYIVGFRSGTCRTEASRDAGRLYHALALGARDYDIARCGARPGLRSQGWALEAHPATSKWIVTCEKCLTKLRKQQNITACATGD